MVHISKVHLCIEHNKPSKRQYDDEKIECSGHSKYTIQVQKILCLSDDVDDRERQRYSRKNWNLDGFFYLVNS